jgi:hypothetical protein
VGGTPGPFLLGTFSGAAGAFAGVLGLRVGELDATAPNGLPGLGGAHGAIFTGFLPAGNATRIWARYYRAHESLCFLSLDQSTVGNMTAALEHVCKQIAPESDSHETRKALADAMLASAKDGARSVVQSKRSGWQN